MRKIQNAYEPEYIRLEKKLNPIQRESYELAKKQGYLKQKGSKGNKVNDAFYHWCEAFGYPYIVIEMAGLTSTINLSFPLDFKSLPDSTIEQLWEIVLRYADPFENNTLFYIRHVPSDEVDNVAKEIFEIIKEAPDEPNPGNYELLDKKIEGMFAEKFKPLNKQNGNVASHYRNQDVVKLARRRANGFCELCNKRAPFKDRRGNPYLEVHHIKWVSRGGNDSVENVVALCPNCHKKMHVLDLPDDRIYLSKKARLNFQDAILS